jgi:hypothetical protein
VQHRPRVRRPRPSQDVAYFGLRRPLGEGRTAATADRRAAHQQQGRHPADLPCPDARPRPRGRGLCNRQERWTQVEEEQKPNRGSKPYDGRSSTPGGDEVRVPSAAPAGRKSNSKAQVETIVRLLMEPVERRQRRHDAHPARIPIRSRLCRAYRQEAQLEPCGRMDFSRIQPWLRTTPKTAGRR